MNGFEAVKRMRIWEAEGRIPRQVVIALTGNARQWQIDQAMEAGMVHDKGPYCRRHHHHRHYLAGHHAYPIKAHVSPLGGAAVPKWVGLRMKSLSKSFLGLTFIMFRLEESDSWPCERCPVPIDLVISLTPRMSS